MLLQPLISPEQLQTFLREAIPVVLLDTRFDLAEPDAGERDYLLGHIPGAHYVHLDRDLCGPKTGINGRHPLPDLKTWQKTVSRWEITPHSSVVIYDAQGGMFAARTWWMLRQLGVESISVLDGGLPGWLAMGGTLEATQAVQINTPSPWPSSPAAEWHNIVVVQELETNPTAHFLLDARSPERYRGEAEPIDAAPGHIPGALNRHFKLNLTPEGWFKPIHSLRAEFQLLMGQTSPREVIHQCGSGVTACHNLLAMEIAGLNGSRLYPGSWSEWCSNPRRPVALAKITK